MMRRLLATAFAAAIALTLLVPAAGATRLLPRDATPMELGYPLWLAKWNQAAFQRAFAAPTSLLAFRGDRCGFPFGKVWMLPAAADGTFAVHCTLPAGKVLLVLVGGLTGWGFPYTQEEYQADLRRFFAPNVSDLQLTVDGRAIRPGHRVTTPVFLLRIPPSNGFGETPGLYTAAARGNLALLSPPSRGDHVISTSATFPDGTKGITYHLTIE